jgi:hypothetical protein
MHSSLPHHTAWNTLDLTGTIQDALTGEAFGSSITCIASTKRQQIKAADWLFDWHSELCRRDRMVFKVELLHDRSKVQGLVSIADKKDHIFMHLIESAAWNKGKNKLYCGVAGNLVACACKLSFELKYDGIVSFIPKTQLVDHYQKTLGAKLFGPNRMFIDTREALTLTKHYLKQSDQ